MKIKFLKRLAAWMGLAMLLAGCETDNEMLRSTATSPMFPPAPANALNAPGLQASGAGYH